MRSTTQTANCGISASSNERFDVLPEVAIFLLNLEDVTELDDNRTSPSIRIEGLYQQHSGPTLTWDHRSHQNTFSLIEQTAKQIFQFNGDMALKSGISCVAKSVQLEVEQDLLRSAYLLPMNIEREVNIHFFRKYLPHIL